MKPHAYKYVDEIVTKYGESTLLLIGKSMLFIALLFAPIYTMYELCGILQATTELSAFVLV